MIGWRRKAKAERARNELMSAEHLYELVNQTLLANFGPLGSYAITRRESSDSDDIFHTMLASSVAHNIVGNLINHQAIALQPAPAVGGSFVAATSAFAATRALPAAPLGAEALPPLRVGSHAAPAATVAAALLAAGSAPAVAVMADAAVAPMPEMALANTDADLDVVTPVAAEEKIDVVVEAAPVTAASAPVPILPLPVSAVSVSLAPIVAVPVSADLAAALTELDQTGPIRTAGSTPAPAAAAAPLPEYSDSHLVGSDQ